MIGFSPIRCSSVAQTSTGVSGCLAPSSATACSSFFETPRPRRAWPRQDDVGAASARTSQSPSGPPSRVGARPQRARVRLPSKPPLWGQSTGRRRTAASQAARATAPEAQGGARAARSHCAGASRPVPRGHGRCSERVVARSSAARSSSPRRHPRSCDPALTARSPEGAASRSDPGPTGTPLPNPRRSDDQQPAPWHHLKVPRRGRILGRPEPRFQILDAQMTSNPRHGSPPRLMAHQPTRCSTPQMARLRDSWRTSLPVVQHPRNPKPNPSSGARMTRPSDQPRGLSARLVTRSLHTYWRFARGLTLGVRAAVISPANEVFLVKHTYVPGWHLPGGGVEASETALAALVRELDEEARIALGGPPTLHGIFFNARISRRDHVLVYIVRDFR